MVEDLNPSRSVPPVPTGAARPGAGWVAGQLPWLLGGIMLVLYGLTLKHALNLENFAMVARAQGLLWSPTVLGPVTYLVTYPFHWLPGAMVPVALNWFTAGCAALSLVWLARAVALLPHDLSKQAADPQLTLAFKPPQLMTRRWPWLPPVVAVLVCGWQLSFWQNAITATSSMINLLMFAHVVRSFLEYNASGRNAWLLSGALVYGLAMANDWFMVWFLPVFILGLLVVKGIFRINHFQLESLSSGRSKLNVHLLWQLPAVGLAGGLLVLLLPGLASLTPVAHTAFWPAFKYVLKTYQGALVHIPKQLLFTFFLISVLPVFLIGLRFYHFLSGFNRVNYFLGAVFFQLVYGFFFLMGLWIMLDAPLSPRRLAPAMPTLPLYFLEALSIGFFAGHFLLTSETQPEPIQRLKVSEFERREQQLRFLTRLLKRLVLAGTLLLAAGIPVTLLCKNLPVLNRQRVDPAAAYIHQMAADLPPAGAVVIGTDAYRLISLQADLLQAGRQRQYLLINLEALAELPEYLDILQQQADGFNLTVKLPQVTEAERRKILPVALLQQLGTNHEIYALHPAPMAETLAEFFYFEPQGLLYHLRAYPRDVAFAEPMSDARRQANQSFWDRFHTEQFADLVRETDPAPHAPVNGLLKRFLHTFRFGPETDPQAQLAGAFYAGALNDWGVELQKAGQWAAAGQCFADALRLNPNNIAAHLNQKFNADHQAGRATPIQTPRETSEGLNEYRDLRHVLRDGAVDEPNFCYLLATLMSQSQLYRPAISQYERVKVMNPDRMDTYTSLTAMFSACRDYTNALVAANELLERSPTNLLGMVFKATTQIQMNRYSQAIPLLDQVLAMEPTNQLALLNRGQAWRDLGQFPTARLDYQALRQINTNDYRAYYALGDMDDRERHPAAALTNYQLFLELAPPNLREVELVKARVKVLQGGSAK